MSVTAAAAPADGQEGSKPSIAFVFAGLMLVLLMAALDQTIVSTALPTIVGDLGGLNHISWVVTAYLLAQTAVTPVYGKLGDLYGRKVVLQAGLVVFLVGSALCGLSQNLTELIAFRALQGLGGGGLIVSAQAAIGDVVSPRERGRYQGYFGAVFGLASVIGPLLGGFFTSSLTWRWIFYVNLPIGVLAFTVLAATLPSRSERVHRRIDYLGAGLLASALAAIVLLTTLGGTSYAWDSAFIIGLGAGAIVLLIAFIVVESRAPEPVLPLRLFRNRVFSVTAGMGFVVGFALFGSVVYIPLFLQVVNGDSPTGSGLRLLPLMAGLLTTSIVSGRLISRTGRYKIFPIIGTALMIVGLFLLSTMTATTTTLQAAVYMLVVGLGLGSTMQVLVLAVQNSVEYQDLGVATSGATLFRSIGGAVGTAILGSVFAGRLKTNLASALVHLHAPLSPAIAKQIQGGADNPAALKKLPPALHSAYIHAFTTALSPVFVVAAGAAAVAFLLSLVLEERPLRDSVSAASGIGESFAVPKHTDSLAEISRALGVLLGREGRRRVVQRLADEAEVDLSPAACWLLVRVGEDPHLDLADIARRFDVPLGVAQQALQEGKERGMVVEAQRSDGPGGSACTLTPAGQAAVAKLIAARRARLARLLDGWSPDQHGDLAHLLTRLAGELAGEPPSVTSSAGPEGRGA
jgi:EmrB/QacA subfamily drug resistance transporter